MVLISTPDLLRRTIPYFLSLLICLFSFSATAISQEKPPVNNKAGNKQYWDFWVNCPCPKHVSTVQLISLKNPLAILSVRLAAKENLAWGLEVEIPEKNVPELDPKLLTDVADDTRLYFLNLKSDADQKKKNELQVLYQAIENASNVGSTAFSDTAEEIPYRELFENPDDHRGKVVTFSGKLSFLREVIVPSKIKDKVPTLYEGWVHLDEAETPITILFATKPEDVRLGARSIPVYFSGYFFKRFNSLNVQNQEKSTLLLIAPGFSLQNYELWLRAQHEKFWVNTKYPKHVAAAQLVFMRDPLAILSHRVAGLDNLVWGLEVDSAPIVAPPLDQEELRSVDDDTPRMEIDENSNARQRAEYRIQCQAIINAATTDPRAFERSAKGSEWKTYSHLYDAPWKHRGDVVPVKGRLVMLRKNEAPPLVRKQGIRFLYTGWVFMETPKSNPVVVFFAKKPENVPLSEKMNQDIKFNGYFFKRLSYEPRQGPKRKTLMFIAPTFETTVPDEAVGPDTGILWRIMAGVLALGVGMVILMSALNMWFRRSDAQVQEKLDNIRGDMFLASLEEESESASVSSNESGPEDENPPVAKRIEDKPSPRFHLGESDSISPN